MNSPASFPLLRTARLQFEFPQPRFSEILLARQLAAKINATRDLETQPKRAVKAGVLAAASLLDEVFAHVIEEYLREIEPAALENANAALAEKLGAPLENSLFLALQKLFDAPTEPAGAIEHQIRLHLANENPALSVFKELFDDSKLPQPIYRASLEALRLYFVSLPTFGPDNQHLLDFLFAPIRAFPDSVEKQLRFVLERWGELAEPFARRILTQLDVLSEENKPVFHGPGPALVPDYKLRGGRGGRGVGMDEYEAFSLDKAWMPNVVLLAKNVFVWLDQLSKKYERHIYRLDMVPDEELDEMAARGFTGLWLIGLWQRSKASQRVKQMCGNPDAVASAYSLHAYDIAWELGGQEAMDNLNLRAAKRGVRMASDMVPNHMAIDSRWVVEHPDWFLSLPHSPFPQYNFEGPDLSEDGRAQIFLENHYYSKSDAAVVFRHVDNRDGQERFIYHGNDGTALPWNDTAQLNYLIVEVREAVLQTILDVARQFPIIRFDAAMTLAKRHYHRLWFPAPGEGGAIPTRAGLGLTADEFDAAFPVEFWREVVERVAQEVPETLLLAEAFWMMEGYFVRTLGMHRVYNSAFMNMMRDEKNAEYRLTMRNTLEFDPDILGRWVNFMNNPDEDTAVEQFGKDDKYFGVATMMATMPGLPMFGHGQIEGYAEKYGMEYPRAYWDERPDQWLLKRHQREIFPLLHKRALFAGSQNFTLYDFWSESQGVGYVNEDVFAFSNRIGNERALVIYHNRFADTAGWIKNSVGFAVKGEEKKLVQRTLGEALGLSSGEKTFAIFRDNTGQLEYLRQTRELCENGLFVQLEAYKCHVFLNWREVHDPAGLYAQLAARLNGRGVVSVEIALREMLLEPLRKAFLPVADGELWKKLAKPKSLDELESRLEKFGVAAMEFCALKGDAKQFAQKTRTRVEQILPVLKKQNGGALLSWALVSQLGLLGGEKNIAEQSRAWLDEWLLASLLETALVDSGLGNAESVQNARILTLISETSSSFALVSGLFSDEAAQEILKINRFEGLTYFDKIGFEAILDLLAQATKFSAKPLKKIAETGGYGVVKTLEATRKTEIAPVKKQTAPRKKVAPKAPKTQKRSAGVPPA